MTRGEEALVQLEASGYLPYVINYQLEETGFRGTMHVIIITHLSSDARFASGLLCGLHLDVGDNLYDFRSWKDAFGKGSLQLVVDGWTGNFWCDVDRFSPYQDLVNFVAHAFGEVVPGWWRQVKAKWRSL